MEPEVVITMLLAAIAALSSANVYQYLAGQRRVAWLEEQLAKRDRRITDLTDHLTHHENEKKTPGS